METLETEAARDLRATVVVGAAAAVAVLALLALLLPDASPAVYRAAVVVVALAVGGAGYVVSGRRARARGIVPYAVQRWEEGHGHGD